jgi:GNAT superfamily N-acetyltransferase
MELYQICQEHLEECANLLVTVFANPPWNENWTFELALKRLQNTYNIVDFYGIIAKKQSRIIGFACGHGEEYINVKTFYLKEMCVALKHQNTGVGTAIINELQKDLAKNNITRIWLLTAPNSPAESFYKKCGFINSDKVILMIKNLAH